MEKLKALFIGAHNDECEYGTGGLAYLLHKTGVQVLFYNTKSQDEPKTHAAAAFLGAEKKIERFDGRIWACSEDHIDNILNVILDFKPDFLFLHYPKDTHSEHRETAKASYQAACLAPAYGWFCKEIYAFEAGPDQTVQYFTPDFVVDISDLMPRLNECYHLFGQGLGDQLYEEKLVGARYRGLKQNCQYGEAYKIIKFPDGGEDLLLRKILGSRFSWFGNVFYPAYGELYF